MEIHKKYVIGLDIGTTSTKASLFSKEGWQVSSAAVEYPITHPKPDWAEQNPEQIYTAILESIREVIKKSKIDTGELIAIGISAAMHSIMAVDENGQPLTNCIIWADNRSHYYAEKLKAEWNGLDIYRRTGTPIHPMSPLSKLLWMKYEQPALYEQASKWISMKEYVMWKWFGDYIVDYSIASTSGLFNLEELDWDDKVLELLELSKDKLSKPVPTTAFYRNMEKTAAETMGIPADLPIIVGASDGVLANLGVGAINEREYAVTIGTSGAIRTVVNKPLLEPKGRTFCYYLADGKWVIGGPVNNGGIALRWLRDQLASGVIEEAASLGKDPYDVLIEKAAAIPAGAEGLIFLPYLSGERAPMWDANTRGAFIGITLTHRKEHFIRAVLEGIIYAVYSVGVLLENMAGKPDRIRVSGGFAQSEVWRQILADVSGKPVSVLESHEGSGLGAATLALYALGYIESLEDVKKMVTIRTEHYPIERNKQVYERFHTIYMSLYSTLKEQFDAISTFQREERE
ncbi:gluconate kinase [Bacillus sp. FJAT-27225]|uniref:gluconokinase n=1 Tax=Bacillus sp. FJAT-27225 TaxID=1743144 RepID=UPI00080C3378|nr:FGGY family carbohydrate kinase [Bacillus sp. FJAT-27225]OCA88242.1 gluconate kinase [Bacillus sp. FJAT-27225]